jgi:hypothetical protein
MTPNWVEAPQEKKKVPFLNHVQVHSKEKHNYEKVQSHKETVRVTKSEGRALTAD